MKTFTTDVVISMMTHLSVLCLVFWRVSHLRTALSQSPKPVLTSRGAQHTADVRSGVWAEQKRRGWVAHSEPHDEQPRYLSPPTRERLAGQPGQKQGLASSRGISQV